MTLKEKLDGKLPPFSSVIWEELEAVFLEVDSKDLLKGVTVSVYKNDHRSPFCYLIKSDSPSAIGSPFSYDFGVDTLNDIINIAKKNGLVVEQVKKGSFYNFTYSPNWK